MIYYHGSKDYFNEIDLIITECLGFHVGSLSQAIMRLSQHYSNSLSSIYKMYIYVVDIDVNNSNSIEIRDVFEDYGLNYVKHELLRHPVIQNFCNNPDFEEILNDSNDPVEIAEVLVSRGIKYLRYNNEIEGDGTSICILDPTIFIGRYKVNTLLDSLILPDLFNTL